MNLYQLKELLSSHSNHAFRIQLPGGGDVPVSFHVTEVGRIQKTFLDCGGKLRESTTCQLQVWVGPDVDHRLETGKMAAILEKAKDYLSDESVPVEVEYEDDVISQYAIERHEVSDEAVVLILGYKHTECLAPELCGLPPLPESMKTKIATGACCGTQCC